MIIILNGPPGSGKDSIADYLVQNNAYRKFQFKERLFELALSISGIDEEEWFDRYEDRTFNMKEEPWKQLGGLSQRQFLIKISEEWIKPVFGKNYFGEILAEKIHDHIIKSLSILDDVVISDSGFLEELKPVLEVPAPKLLVRLYSKGCSFKGDSRNYLPVTAGIATISIHNDYLVDPSNTIDAAVYKILNAAKTGDIQ